MIGRLISRLRKVYQLATDPIGYHRRNGVRIGKDCRLLGTNTETFGSEPYLVKLGDHVTVTGGVQFVTHDGGVWVFREKEPDIDVFGPITVGSNVFIGFGSIIMPGVTIGDNCVIGAGSVVTRDVESGTVVAGVPAKRLLTIDEYRAKIEPKVTHIRGLPPEEKARILKERFGIDK
jgi:acetyltransferase-like isoleucine patch superfamily enzyme